MSRYLTLKLRVVHGQLNIKSIDNIKLCTRKSQKNMTVDKGRLFKLFDEYKDYFRVVAVKPVLRLPVQTRPRTIRPKHHGAFYLE